MELGYISSSHPMHWKKINTSFFKRLDNLTYEASYTHFFNSNNLESYRCTNCRITLAHY